MENCKVFISTIPFLQEGKLSPVVYKPIGNSRLEYSKETRFPIIPLINGYANRGDKVRVLAILADGEMSNAVNTKRNFYAYFEPEISDLVRQNGLELENIEKIFTPDSEDIDSHLKLFSDIAEAINPGEDVYACITYGTKPMPIVLTMALNYVYKLKKDISIGCTVYGRFPHIDEDTKTSFIYDTTSLFYMDSIVNKLSTMRASDPAKVIKLMLGYETTEDTCNGVE